VACAWFYHQFARAETGPGRSRNRQISSDCMFHFLYKQFLLGLVWSKESVQGVLFPRSVQ